jgi:hypothetical protein
VIAFSEVKPVLEKHRLQINNCQHYRIDPKFSISESNAESGGTLIANHHWMYCTARYEVDYKLNRNNKDLSFLDIVAPQRFALSGLDYLIHPCLFEVPSHDV